MYFTQIVVAFRSVTARQYLLAHSKQDSTPLTEHVASLNAVSSTIKSFSCLWAGLKTARQLNIRNELISIPVSCDSCLCILRRRYESPRINELTVNCINTLSRYRPYVEHCDMQHSQFPRLLFASLYHFTYHGTPLFFAGGFTVDRRTSFAAQEVAKARQRD